MQRDKESVSRIIIDKLLEKSGWILEDQPNPNVITEVRSNGDSDYVMLDSQNNHLCVIEAKRPGKHPLSAKRQSRDYAKSLGCNLIILSNGNSHYLWNIESGNPQRIYRFPTQKRLEESIKKETYKVGIIDKNLIGHSIYPDFEKHPDFLDQKTHESFLKENNIKVLHDYQLEAVLKVKDSIESGNQRFLLEMATGTGKTLISAALIKMFLRDCNVNKALFLVDRIELEGQAYESFNSYLKNDYKTVIWKENKDDWRSGKIIVSTIQSFIYDTKYKELFNHNDFGLVIVDEAHRSLGVRGRDVLEYFDGFKVGLTATPRDYFRGIEKSDLMNKNQFNFEQRVIRDTYETFGCNDRDPTFKYTLERGVKEGYLIQPTVIKATTSITTQMLSEKGLHIERVDENGNIKIKNVKRSDFEKTVFNDDTNKTFCKIFMDHCKKDPVTNEIGKTIIFCVSQNHASDITQILNEMAHERFPNCYSSDFAEQVTSDVPDSNDMTVNFNHDANNLNGTSSFNKNYRTSKTRVCVTVGMMTTGYDCQDLLNVCFMRPVMSPTDFVQMKGRGTRTFNFINLLLSEKEKYSKEALEKKEFLLFDFFGNFEFFEKDYDYDSVINIPKDYGSVGGGREQIRDKINLDTKDSEYNIEMIFLPNEGMKIDSSLYPKLKENLLQDEDLKDFVENNEFENAEKLLFEKNNNLNLDNISLSLGLDRKITPKELLLHLFDFIEEIPSKRSLIETEFLNFEDEHNIPMEDYKNIKLLFESYLLNEEFRELVDEKRFASLETHELGHCVNGLSKGSHNFLEIIPDFIGQIEDPERFKVAVAN